jgi:hypothetical protein
MPRTRKLTPQAEDLSHRSCKHLRWNSNTQRVDVVIINAEGFIVITRPADKWEISSNLTQLELLCIN